MNRRLLTTLVGLVAATVVVVGVVAAVDRSTRHAAGGPAAASDAYYRAVHAGDAAGAYALLCPAAQQALGASSYAASLSQDDQTGTGVRSWTRHGAVEIRGDAAAVPGTVTTDDGTATPLTVYLLETAGRWQVCTSSLGGVLPGPGSSASGGTGGSGGGVAT